METIYISPQVLRTEFSESQKREAEAYRGIMHPFSSPYHLYLRVSDLGTDDIHFVVYSMGKTKIIMSGVYSLKDGRFFVTYACNYKTARRLMAYLDLMRDSYINTLNIVKNRVNKRLNAFWGVEKFNYQQTKLWLTFQPQSAYYTDQAEQDRLRRLEPSFVEQLYQRNHYLASIGPLEKRLLRADLQGNLDEVLDLSEEIKDQKLEAVRQLDTQVRQEEELLNFHRSLTRFAPGSLLSLSADKLITDISEQFYNWIVTSKYVDNNWINEQPLCNEGSEEPLFGFELE